MNQQFRRTKFLINPRFQLRFTFYVCAWLLALSFIYPLIIYNLFEYFTRSADVSPTNPAYQEIVATKMEVIMLLAGFQLAFLGLTFLISLFLSHRIAGPLFKLRQTMEKVKAGDLDVQVSFRRKDHFKEVADEFNQMMDSIRSKLSDKK